MLVFIVLLLVSSFSLAQPYEPIILLDVTGAVDDQLGFGSLNPVSDQDGDGKDDIQTAVLTDTWRTELRIYYGSSTNEIRYVQFGHIDTSEYDHYWDDPRVTTPQGDYNGDGQTDLLFDLCRRVSGQCQYQSVLFNGGPSVFDTIPDCFGLLGNMQFTTNVGDYDGDERDDVTRRPLNGNYFGFYRSADPLPSVPTWTAERGTGNTQYGSDHSGFGDFNGDGFSDFGVRYGHVEGDYYTNFDLFLGSPEADSLPGYIYQWGTVPQEFETSFHFVGDVNGDGYDDLISYFVSWWTGSEKRLYYGGDPFDFEADSQFYHEHIPRNHLGLGDINHDSYDDFVSYEQGAGFEVYLGGNPPTLEPVWALESPFEGMEVPYRIGPAGDFNGDGIDDWMFSCYEGGERRGRIIVIAGDERFGLPAREIPDFCPFSFILYPSYPNPFNSSTTIPFELTGSRMQRVAFTIYNTLGQVVFSYPPQTYTPGTHRLVWNGQTNNNPTSGGVYFLVAATNTTKQTMKLVYLP